MSLPSITPVQFDVLSSLRSFLISVLPQGTEVVRGHYVYIHCRPDGSPFYVGKGSGRRCRTISSKYRNPYYQNVVEKYGAKNISIKTYTCGSVEIAFRLERELIRKFRLSGVKLTNFNDGGEGSLNPSPLVRSKMSRAKLGKAVPLERRNKISISLKGKPKSLEHIAAVAAALRGRVPSEDEKIKHKLAAEKRRGKKQYPELIAKRIAPLIGRKRSDEFRSKMSIIAKARGVSRAFIEAGAKARRGCKLTAEQIQRREATKANRRRLALAISVS